MPSVSKVTSAPLVKVTVSPAVTTVELIRATVIASSSTSVSFARTSMEAVALIATVAVSATATGASFTPLIVAVTVTVLDRSPPSLA